MARARAAFFINSCFRPRKMNGFRAERLIRREAANKCFSGQASEKAQVLRDVERSPRGARWGWEVIDESKEEHGSALPLHAPLRGVLSPKSGEVLAPLDVPRPDLECLDPELNGKDVCG